MAPSRACSASILCGAARNVGSGAGCLRAVESKTGMVPVRAIARCGQFAARASNSAIARSQLATQHRASLNNGSGYACNPRFFDSRAGEQWKRRLGISPVTHCKVTKFEKCDAALDAASVMDGGRLFACESQRRLMGCLDSTQPRLFPRNIIAGRGREALPLRHLDLEYDHLAQPKRHFRASQIELPHSHETLVVEAHNLVAMGQKAFAPGFERLGVMQLQDLNVSDDQARPLDRTEDLRQGRNVAAGKDILGDPRIGDAGRAIATDCM